MLTIMVEDQRKSRMYGAMKTLIESISRSSNISPTQAEVAMKVVLEFFSTRLPSPVMGRIRETLGSRSDGTAEPVIAGATDKQRE